MTRAAPARVSRASRARRAVGIALLLATATLGGCGQRGPLTLPASAQPVKRLPPAGQAQPPAPQTGTETLQPPVQQVQPEAVRPPQPPPPTPSRNDGDRTENER